MTSLLLLVWFAVFGMPNMSSTTVKTADTELMQAQIGAALTASAYAGRTNDTSADVSDDKRYEYTPSEAVSISVRTEMAHYIAQSPLLSSALRDGLQHYFADADVMAAIAPEIERRGYPVHSVATAVTTWVLVNYEIIHDVEVTPAQAKGLYRQVAGLFATLPDFKAADDADKQRMAEGLYWIAHLQKFASDQAKAGTADFTQEDVMRQSRAIFEAYGLELDRLELGDAGFIQRKAADSP